MNTLTLRKIPAPVEQRLRLLARDTRQSINKTVVDLLTKSVGLGPEKAKSRKLRDVKSAVRRWTNEEYLEFQSNTKVFEKIDEDVWR